MEKPRRPTLADPVEFATVKRIYFPADPTFDNPTDELERLDRMQRKNTTNQAR